MGIILGSIWGSFQGWGSFRGQDHFGGCTDNLAENTKLQLSSELRAVTLSNIMANSEQKLRKANKELKDEVAELKVKLEKVLKELSDRTEECKHVGNSGEVLSPDKTKSVEFASDQYDDLIAFKVSTSKELEEIRVRLDKISETCDHIQKSLDAFELYSYQFYIKIVGMPMVAEREHPKQTANLCLQLFSALGVKRVSIQDIDTAHRVPSMKPSNRPNAIVCRFVRRLKTK